MSRWEPQDAIELHDDFESDSLSSLIPVLSTRFHEGDFTCDPMEVFGMRVRRWLYHIPSWLDSTAPPAGMVKP